MSAPPPQVRRTDRVMSEEAIQAALDAGYCGRLATVGSDGAPYCVPLLYVMMGGEVYVHNTAHKGHLRSNVDHEKRVCFEIDQAGQVFDYGRFECDSSVEYKSVIVFGNIRVVDDEATKRRFCDALMAKYRRPEAPQRPKSFYPRLADITVYAIKIARMTGKELALPDVSEQWPAKDRTKSPHAKA
jgi:nitroimidazol reductase NimA-like FMN-containing flavoprotein (pyridoxamine 5'-phosphate oxidase superfamily)